jgi:MoxR-like ATPase
VILVDDISRLSPKTNSVVQQASSGPTVKVEGYEYELPRPNLVLATNYVDPDLVDATPGPQDDRFMLKLALPYPPYEVDYQIADSLTRGANQQPQQVLLPEQLMRYRQTVLQVSAPPPVIHYAVRLTRATRVHEEETPDFVFEWVSSGAGPRAVHYLTLAAKARAALHGRGVVDSDDIRQVTHAVLRHRISTNHNARANGVSVNKVIDRLLYEIPEREPGDEERQQAEG